MMQRLRELLRGPLAGGAAPPQLRPNELRPEVVRAERLRREALQREQRLQAETSQRAPSRPAPAPSPGPRPERGAGAEQHPLAALRSRSDLRQALLLKEILDPPVALRQIEDLERRP